MFNITVSGVEELETMKTLWEKNLIDDVAVK